MSTSTLFNKKTQHQKKRDAIVLAAAKTFNECGYAKASLDMIAGKLGVTKKALYHYVENKSDILFLIFQQWLDVQKTAIEHAENSSSSSEQRVRLYAEKYIELVLSELTPMDRIVGELSLLKPAQRKAVYDRRHEYDKRVRAFFVEGAGTEFADMDPKYAVYVLNGTIDWVFKWYRPDGELTVHQAADKVVSILMNGFIVRK